MIFALCALAGATELPELNAPDRSAPPAVDPPALLELDEAQQMTLSNGVHVEFVRVPGVRRVEVDVRIERGQTALPDIPMAQWQMLNAALGDATRNRSPEAVSIYTDLYDIDLNYSVSVRRGRADISVPRENLAQAVELLAETIAEPAFLRKELRRSARNTLQWVVGQAQHRFSTTANYAMVYHWYRDHPFGRRPDYAGALRVKPSQLTKLYERWRDGAPAIVSVAGDVSWSDVEPLLEAHLVPLTRPGHRAPPVPEVVPPAASVLGIDMPGSSQAMIQLLAEGPRRDSPEFATANAANFALGGHFLSRLNANLREDKGLTYGARSNLYAFLNLSRWTLSVEVRGKDVGAALTEVRHELARLLDEGITPAELDAAWRAEAVAWNTVRANASSASNQYTTMAEHGDTAADVRTRIEQLANLDLSTVGPTVRTYLDASAPHLWVFVGDRATLEPQLAEFGLEPRWITAAQAVNGRF
ncbi:MAG: insulinase family protein [Myxococcota bacterium]